MKKLLLFTFILCSGFLFAQNSDLKTEALKYFKTIPEYNLPSDDEILMTKIKLGKLLYNDPRLSKNQNIACATCHNLSLGGVDGLSHSLGFKAQLGGRNAPTVYNAVYNISQFWDGRAADLKEQAKGPLLNPVEMANDKETVIAVVKSMPTYVSLFQNAYPDVDDPITFDNIAECIAEFEKTLVTPGSKFDKYLSDDGKLNKSEILGLELFINSGCAECHRGVNFSNDHYIKFGIVESVPEDVMANDLGRYNVTKKEEDKYKFKVPTLRNIEKTSPYFHSGATYNLSDAIKIMGKYQLGLELSEEQVNYLIAFLKTLNGKLPAQEFFDLPVRTATTPLPKLQ